MKISEVRVTFAPGGATAVVPAGELLLGAAVSAGLPLSAPCGGRGRCGKCKVQILKGQCSPVTEQERAVLSPEELASGTRLACQALVETDVEVWAQPEQEVVGKKPLEDHLLEGLQADPVVKHAVVSLSKPSLQDQRSDFQRLCDGLQGVLPCREASPRALWALPRVLRDNDFRVAVTAREGRLLEVTAPGAAQHPLGAAVDIGTTTVVAYLVDLVTGEHIGSGAAHNPQGQHGADVISRTEYAKTAPDGLGRLQREAAGVVNQVLGQALSSYGAGPERLYEITVVGNTCMHHMFLGLDPRYIAEAPYIPVNAACMTVAPGDVGIRMHAEGRVVTLPVIAGYVGADTVGVILATRLVERKRPVLAIDIGTNGEVVLWTGERLLCASCAAGPAFEGAQIEQGMRAAPGAISAVDLPDGDLHITTIANQPPVGICGSGLFDAMAVALEAGFVDMMGRMVGDDALDSLPPSLARRLTGEGPQRRMVLASADEAHTGRPVYLSQRDVREIQLAKGAVRAAVELLLREAELELDDVEEVLLAGAFGNHIRPESALRIGMLPPVEADRVRGVGNAAGAGAMMALISAEQRQLACSIAQTAQHLELAQRPEFQQTFMETMLFMEP
ncbi:MAG: DUF4445 domain-containing protein [Armatimonadetes bacterium]|nr:DUF4445 domain-containing protein [Armatimonadota bacterium]